MVANIDYYFIYQQVPPRAELHESVNQLILDELHNGPRPRAWGGKSKAVYQQGRVTFQKSQSIWDTSFELLPNI